MSLKSRAKRRVLRARMNGPPLVVGDKYAVSGAVAPVVDLATVGVVVRTHTSTDPSVDPLSLKDAWASKIQRFKHVTKEI